MACSGGHFPVPIHKDTREDHKRCIIFSWNRNGLFVWAKDKSCQNGSGQQPRIESKPNVFPKPPKDKSRWNEDGRWLSNEKSRCLLKCLLSIPSNRSSKSLFEGVTS